MTSPPYFLENAYEKDMSWNDHMSMIDDVLSGCRKALKNHRVIAWNIAHSPRKNVPAYHALALEKHFTFVDTIVWQKTTVCSPRFGTTVLNDKYFPNLTYEMIYVYAKGTYDIRIDEPVDYSKQFRNDVLDVQAEGRDTGHPAPFSEHLVEPIIRLYSNKGDTVMDPFGGSGTTGYVASKFDRNSVMVERDPKYCDLIKKRLRFGETLFNDCKFVPVLHEDLFRWGVWGFNQKLVWLLGFGGWGCCGCLK